ncbi:MAG: RNA polymerase sigma factor, partial [Candidatus Poribacteria bacterium]|nr:RNA polymerase sigma factor [Candidatus Poribacteria bacterium]
MENNDVQLIRKILSGDNEAFTTLVGRYQKSVQALAWRKIGDFHIAEEITQDTFLQAYKKLATLRNPNQFAGWLYVIATNLCNRWLQKKKLSTQSLEGTSVVEIENASYKRYVSEQRETEITERHHEIVKKLLQRLPESERTVVTLHYLGEMTIKEISKFLGVSANTINSRLRRARARLQEREELLIQEMLGSVQLPVNLMENIAQQVANIKPAPPTPVGKPLVPWAALGTVAVFIILGLGVGNQYIVRYQKPYSFEAQAEPTIEIVDAPIILDIDTKLDTRNQIEQTIIPNRNNRTIPPVDIETPTASKFEEPFFGFTAALAQEIPTQNVVEDELDLKALLAAIKHHDALLKSGEGEVVYTLGVPPFVDTDTRIITGTLAFNKEK